ncbi:MAG TPA: 1-deoxy-D-xylulose-5-phosphate reductoisomerase [Thermodesulfobacteriaceae bacterium]|nr:1-deoxy-D-xylulose-5-phosphate reductoisomerase [Thermodesulfobacteriaceae bacterium]
MCRAKKVVVLGSTGSIGTSVLEVIRQSEERFWVAGLAAGRNAGLLVEQIREFRPGYAAIMTAELAEEIRNAPGCEDTEILWGKEGYKTLAALEEGDVVVSAMVGAAGLIPTLAALEAGKDVALANKESLVTAGPLVTSLAREKGVRLLPVDSEHSAVFQCLQGHCMDDVKRIVLTASGGPFREKTLEELAVAGPEDAVSHPNWSMGAKISVDSATLMNKGLEVIEARWLFDIPVDRIDVVVHPQSIVHSMVEYIDGSVIAQLGVPDMKVPIAYALSYPRRMKVQLPGLNLMEIGSLTFEAPKADRFPLLGLAYQAAETGGTAPTALNAANEVAVEAFLDRQISFLKIAEVVQEVVEDFPIEPIESLDDVLRADALARLRSDHEIQKLSNGIGVQKQT